LDRRARISPARFTSNPSSIFLNGAIISCAEPGGDIVFKTTFDYIAGQGLQKAVTYKHKNGLPSTAALRGVVHKASSPIELISLQGAYERTFVDPISREQFIDYIKVTTSRSTASTRWPSSTRKYARC
jgi:hypothetical protein